MSQIPTVPLDNSPTLEVPKEDPGIIFKLERRYMSGRDCFDKFLPYLTWLRSFIQKNKWLDKEIAKEFQQLWDLYRRTEGQFRRINAVMEFLHQKAHSEINDLWITYRELRLKIEDLATNRVTLKVEQAVNAVAFNKLQNRGWTSEAVGSQDTDSPEDPPSDRFFNPEGTTYTPLIGVSGV